MIHELDCIVLQVDLPEHNLTRGDVGVVVFVHSAPEAYVVEFVSFDGQTIALSTLNRSQFRPIVEREIAHARSLDNE